MGNKRYEIFLLMYLSLLELSILAQDCPSFECPEQNGSFADPCTCRRFYRCDQGAIFKSFCPNGLYWDDEKKICTYKEIARCGPLNETTKNPMKIIQNPCDQSQCDLPFCFCSKDGTSRPFQKNTSPQVVMVTFDGAINNNNFDHIQDIITLHKNITNIKLTFFINHEYSDYTLINKLYTEGNEIALSTVTGKSLEQRNVTEWQNEINLLLNILETHGQVPREEIVGIRAPLLRPGSNSQYDALYASGILWDSSIATKKVRVPVWPYTLDYDIPHVCKYSTCPNRSFPGLWEIPLNDHYVENEGGNICSFLDQCVFTYQSVNDIFTWLKTDFERYEENNAPYMIPIHTNWLLQKNQKEALIKFLIWIKETNKAHFATITETLLWLTDISKEHPIKSPEILSAPMNKKCGSTQTCATEHKTDEGINEIRYLSTCNENCPDTYPWLL